MHTINRMVGSLIKRLLTVLPIDALIRRLSQALTAEVIRTWLALGDRQNDEFLELHGRPAAYLKRASNNDTAFFSI